MEAILRKVEELFSEMLEHGAFYNSAIELDAIHGEGPGGEEIEMRIRQLQKEIKEVIR